MTFQLSGDQVAILADPIETKTASGLHVPENVSTDKKPRYGTVVDVGPGRRSDMTGELIPFDIEPGDRVFFHRGHDNVWELDGEEYLLLRPNEILGIHEAEGLALVEGEG